MRNIDNPSSANILPGDCIVATSAQRAALSLAPEDAGKVIVEKDSGRMYLATLTEGAKPLGANIAAELASIGITPSATYPVAQISDATYSPWSKYAGGGNSSIAQSPVAGFAARLKSNSTSSGYVVGQRAIAPVVLASSDVFSVAINVLDASSTRNVRITLAEDIAAAAKAYIVGYQTWHPGRNVMSFKLSDCTFAGGATAGSTWNYLRIDVTNNAYASETFVDIGPAWVGGAARVPAVCIGFDSGYTKVYDWAFPAMRANGIVGNVYAMPSTAGTGDRCSVGQLQELYAAGWDIGLYGNVDGMGANNHTKDGVTLAQSVGPGGSFAINGTIGSTLSPPRVVTVYIASGSEGANAFTITGTAPGGEALSELVAGPAGSATKAYTKSVFATVTSITALNATSVPVSFGTGFTQDEYLAQFALQRAWLSANGFSRGWAHYAYPLGEFNHESETWLSRSGFKTARTVTTGTTLYRNQLRGVPTNQLFMSAAVTIGDPGSFSGIQTQINNAISRGCDVMVLGHLGGAVAPSQSELNSAVAWLGTLHRAGTIRVMSFSEYEAAKGL